MAPGRRESAHGRGIRDFIGENDGFQTQWQAEKAGAVWYQRHLLLLRFELDPAETKTLTLRMRPCSDAPGTFSYRMEYEKSLQFWNAQLGKIRRVPASERHQAIVRNLVLQCLQMFAYPQGKDCVYPRQGGLQRIVWRRRLFEFLIALDMLGDFSEYTKTAYDTFFGEFQKKTGEECGGIFCMSGWASNNGAALWCCGHYLATIGTEPDFFRYRNDMLLAFAWIQKKRALSYEMDCPGKGIFPPMKSSDGRENTRAGITDCTNLEGLRWAAEGLSALTTLAPRKSGRRMRIIWPA